MAVVVLLIVLAVIVFLLYQSVQDARRKAGDSQTPSEPPRPARPGRSTPSPRVRPVARARPRKVRIDEAALAEHVAKLRDAVAGDLITLDEAVDSVLRHTDGALSPEAARKLLNGRAD